VLLAFAWWAAAGWHVHLIGKLDRLLSLDPGCAAPSSTMACGWHLVHVDQMAYLAQPPIAIGLPFAAPTGGLAAHHEDETPISTATGRK
jgi:hypothetical protein